MLCVCEFLLLRFYFKFCWNFESFDFLFELFLQLLGVDVAGLGGVLFEDLLELAPFDLLSFDRAFLIHARQPDLEVAFALLGFAVHSDYLRFAILFTLLPKYLNVLFES